MKDPVKIFLGSTVIFLLIGILGPPGLKFLMQYCWMCGGLVTIFFMIGVMTNGNLNIKFTYEEKKSDSTSEKDKEKKNEIFITRIREDNGSVRVYDQNGHLIDNISVGTGAQASFTSQTLAIYYPKTASLAQTTYILKNNQLVRI